MFCQRVVFDRGIGLWYSKMRIMNTDFFVRLIVATHKVVNILPKEDLLRTQVQDSANKLLVSLILLAQESSVAPEQRRTVATKAIREIGELIAYLNYAKRIAQINPQNFVVLEREYNKVGEFLRQLHQSNTELAPYQAGSGAALSRSPKSFSPKPPKSDLGAPKSDLSTRQTRILELMRNKPKVQVWELQKVLPEVTKRTLRRDLDGLLERSFIIRQGEWNQVFYQIR